MVKLAKPRVPYLSELAMDIDESLIALVRRDPTRAVREYEQALKMRLERRIQRDSRTRHPTWATFII